MAVITVSRQVGSLRTEIDRESARCLNYEYVDKEKLEQLLKGFGFPEPEMEKFDEKKPPFWDSLSLERRKFLHSTQAVLYDLASKDRVVIVGRMISSFTSSISRSDVTSYPSWQRPLSEPPGPS